MIHRPLLLLFRFVVMALGVIGFGVRFSDEVEAQAKAEFDAGVAVQRAARSAARGFTSA